MKKLFILLLILSALSAKSQFYTKFKPVFDIEIGTKDRTLNFYERSFINKSAYDYPANSFYSDIKIGVRFHNFYLTTNIISNFSYSGLNSKTFTPFLSEYYFDLYYKAKFITFGYQHFCSHATISQDNINFSDTNYINDSHDKIYIKFTILK